jgi:hypothetical protein
VSVGYGRQERGQKRAAQLLANYEAARKRARAARIYDRSQYDGAGREDE